MTNQYAEFIVAYRQLRLGNLDYLFAISTQWQEKLGKFTLDELLGAVGDLTADWRSDFPLNDLPLLIEHATIREEKRTREERRRKEQQRFDYGPKEPSSASWDEQMLRRGIISRAEAKRRQKEREASNV